MLPARPTDAPVAVVLPALDEEATVGAVVRSVPADWQVVVVDNGSTDATAARAREAGAEVVHEPEPGYGTAVLAGMAHLAARPSGPPEVLVVLDADGADAVELAHRLVDPILDGRADLVLSDRTATAERGALTPLQIAGNGLAVRLIERVTGHRYRDMGPFRAIRWRALRALEMEDPTWGWNVEMQIKAVRRGLRILEIPLPYRRRAGGVSKISGTLRGATRAGSRIVWAVHHYRHG